LERPAFHHRASKARVNAFMVQCGPRSLLIMPNLGRSKMRLSKYLALGAATAGLILIVAAPSHAQQGKTIQNQRQFAVEKKPVAQPRPVASTVRDHRKSATSTKSAAGGVTVNPTTGEKRTGSSSCVRFAIGGCVSKPGGIVYGAAKAVSKIPGSKSVGFQDQTRNKDAPGKRDHRNR